MRHYIFPSMLLILLVLKHNIKKAGPKEDKLKSLLELESEANKTRKQDISKLPYITIPKDTLPFGRLTPISRNEQTILGLMDKKILNLTGITNTALKKQYGVANLDFLTQCDENFTLLVRSLNGWAKAFFDANLTDEARCILEYSITIGSDIRQSYQMLADIYFTDLDHDALLKLRNQAEGLSSLSTKSILEYIDTLL